MNNGQDRASQCDTLFIRLYISTTHSFNRFGYIKQNAIQLK